MKRAAVILIPAALFAATIWLIVRGIAPMVVQENNNKMHAMLLGCTYVGPLYDHTSILVFKCNNRIELHTEIKW